MKNRYNVLDMLLVFCEESMSKLLQAFNQKQIERLTQGKHPLPDIRPGDLISVYVRIKEGERERIQKFEGRCIAKRNAGLDSSFLLRRAAGEFSVERRFCLYSPLIERIECLSRGVVRRNKLYYLRYLSRKKARIKERRPGQQSA